MSKRGMPGRGLWLPLQASTRMVCLPVRSSQEWIDVITPPALRLIVARRQPVALGRKGVGVELGKEILGRKARPHLFFDARHAHVADVTILH